MPTSGQPQEGVVLTADSADFGVDVALDGTGAIVMLRGELDVATRADLHRALRQVAAFSSHVVVDLRDLTFIDAAGLAPIVEARTLLRARSGTLSLRSPCRIVARVLEFSGFGQLVE